MRPAPDFLILRSAMDAVVEARHGDPFAVLGPHEVEGGIVIRAFVPGAMRVEVVESAGGQTIGSLEQRHPAGFFENVLEDRPVWLSYRLRATSHEGVVWEFEDPYRFGPVLGPLDDHLMLEGTHRRLWEKLGAHVIEHQGVQGVHFAVWAPNAERVAVVGEFNGWDGRRHPMRRRMGAGVFELFLPGVGEGALYKYEIRGPDGNLMPLKADPVGFAAEFRPGTASKVARIDDFAWQDQAWMERRDRLQDVRAPISIYEVHLGSWARGEGNRFLTYDELADRLIPYAVEMGFTHLELLPITEHPFDGSWGYQPLGLFAPTSRFGSPADFARFVERCHEAGLGRSWTGCPDISRPMPTGSAVSTARRSTSMPTRARASTRTGTP
jgi:1,4-alpha-glucan branching enzyme